MKLSPNILIRVRRCVVLFQEEYLYRYHPKGETVATVTAPAARSRLHEDSLIPSNRSVSRLAFEHIDQLAKKYMGADKYPYNQEGDVRVIFKISADKVSGRI